MAQEITPTAAAESTAMSSGSWAVLYFDAPTRGEQLRMLMAAAGQEFDDKRLPKYPKDLDPYRHAAMGDKSPLLFDQCPTVISPEGVSVSQVAAAMMYAGTRLCLLPEPDDDSSEAAAAANARALSLTLFSEELRNNCFYKMMMGAIVNKVSVS